MNIVNQLPSTQQQKLHEFQNTFEASIEDFAQHYIAGLEKRGVLDGTASRAREYFQLEDKEGLVRQLAGLQAHRDKKVNPEQEAHVHR